MKIINQILNFQDFMRLEKEARGFASLASMPLNAESAGKLSFALKNPEEWPDYMRKTASARADIISSFPWAKSLIMTALPFRKLPASPREFPIAGKDEFSGIVAGYAANRIDYHIHMRSILQSFLEKLFHFAGDGFRAEICVDTKPLAEKPLANISGLGRSGFNSCVLCPGEGSGVCIGSIITAFDLPGYRSSEAFAPPCPSCEKCRALCPNQAIGNTPDAFRPGRCISYLSMEKKGLLNAEERQMLGNNVFGCDICTNACPGSKPSPSLAVDLEWLLLSKRNEIEKTIMGTALEYAGITRLKRNAMIVLGNKKNGMSTALLEKSVGTLNSVLLKETAYQILNEKDIKL